MRHTKKTEKKRGVFVLFWIPLCFLAAELYSTQRRRLLQKIEREKTTNAQRERERERYKEDAI